MKKYYKIVDGQTRFATTQSKVIIEGKWVINPTEEMLIADGWKEYFPPKREKTLESAKQQKLAQVDEYDTSEDVNSFVLNGNAVWLSKADRVGLMNSINIEKIAGRDKSTLWFNGVKFVVNIDQAIQLLSMLELYALECYNVTASHKASIEQLTTIEEVEAYDFTIGYPQKLIINL